MSDIKVFLCCCCCCCGCGCNHFQDVKSNHLSCLSRGRCWKSREKDCWQHRRCCSTRAMPGPPITCCNCFIPPPAAPQLAACAAVATAAGGGREWVLDPPGSGNLADGHTPSLGSEDVAISTLEPYSWGWLAGLAGHPDHTFCRKQSLLVVISSCSSIQGLGSKVGVTCPSLQDGYDSTDSFSLPP